MWSTLKRVFGSDEKKETKESYDAKGSEVQRKTFMFERRVSSLGVKPVVARRRSSTIAKECAVANCHNLRDPRYRGYCEAHKDFSHHSPVDAPTHHEYPNSLQALLALPIGIEYFREFLQSEFSEENLSFILDCEKFRQNFPAPVQDKAAFEAEARRIYAQYMAIDAPTEVNLPSLIASSIAAAMRIRRNIPSEEVLTMKLDEETVNSLSGDLFIEAERNVFQLVETDSYRRFNRSVYAFKLTTQLATGPNQVALQAARFDSH
eukprot:TRINITY_DN2625_c0_g3_i2.p1 TRINITY_DN2625_c0_g3~~TRINITY_DN2625_c0_g3_i2.p1  ORF type:complete len:263 (+),score=29.77 TRINITY_DN2625_c0_g3_i2:124-912(+)